MAEIRNFEVMSNDELIGLYVEAKDTYYNTGENIMSDYDFDTLEQILLQRELIDLEVGTDTLEEEGKRIKRKHLTPMLSLAKTNVYESSLAKHNYEEVIKLLSRQQEITSETELIFTYKLDGCSINTIWEQGNFKLALTRNNGVVGFDVTERLRHLMPVLHHECNFTGELRGEVVMKKSVFNEKYASKYKNPRNLVSGIINDENPNDPRLQDIDVVFFDARGNTNLQNIPTVYDNTIKACFIHENIASHIMMSITYDQFLERRKEHMYGVDGIVISLSNVPVSEIKTNHHDPFHKVAVKFPPEETTTVIKEISWQLGKSGRYTPVGILEPVDLDGSIVSRVSLYNYQNVQNLKLYPGTTIAIAKNGDIIPAVQRIVSPSKIYDDATFAIRLPKGTKIDGAYLVDDGSDTYNVKRMEFVAALNLIGFEDFGWSAFNKLYGFTGGEWIHLFDPFRTNYDTLASVFTGHRTRTKFIDRILARRNNGFHIHTLIMMMGIPQLGHKTAEVLGKELSGSVVSYSGLTRSVIQQFKDQKYELDVIIEQLKTQNIAIHYYGPEKEEAPGITFEMTGDVNVTGFKTKSDVVKVLTGWKHQAMSKKHPTTYLICDDKSSDTNKMKLARSLGIEILTYEEAIKLCQ